MHERPRKIRNTFSPGQESLGILAMRKLKRVAVSRKQAVKCGSTLKSVAPGAPWVGVTSSTVVSREQIKRMCNVSSKYQLRVL